MHLPAVTVTMTTCNRLRLTQESLRTFFQFNSDVKIRSFKIVVDYFNATFARIISEELPNVQLLRLVSNGTKPDKRMIDNIQLLFTHVLQDGVDFWVHLEDDWNFVKSSFITVAMKVFDSIGNSSSIWQVMGREPNTFLPKVKDTFGWQKTADNMTFSVLNMLPGGGGHCGLFTTNDSVIRVEKAKKWVGDFSKINSEWETSRMIRTKYGSQVAILKHHRYYHTGFNSSTMH